MKRWIEFITISAVAVSTLGCSMCCGPYDFDYPDFGGKHERVDPQYGRVGSIFSDPNAGFTGPSADSNLAPPPEPNSSSSGDLDDGELERLKRDLENDLESIDPLKDRSDDPDLEQLPDPGDESTASRPLRNQLRPTQTWR